MVLLLEYLKVLIWPVVVVIAMVLYREAIRGLIPGAKITLEILGYKIETSFPVVQRSLTESLWDSQLTEKQVRLLATLRRDGHTAFDKTEESLDVARPLRNAGLIKHQGAKYLAGADQIEITALGKLVADAVLKSQKRMPRLRISSNLISDSKNFVKQQTAPKE